MNQIAKDYEEEIFKLQAEIRELNDTIVMKERVIAAQKATNQNNSTHQATLRNKISSYEDKIKRLEILLSKQNETNQTLKKQLQVANSALSDTQNENIQQKKRIQQFLALLLSTQNIKQVQKNDKPQTKKELQIVKNELKQKINQNKNLADLKQLHEKEIRKLKEAVKQSQQKFRELTQLQSQRRESDLLPSEIGSDSHIDASFPDFIKENSKFQRKPAGDRYSPQLQTKKQLSADPLTSQIKICSLEERNKELEEALNQSNKKEILKHKIAQIEQQCLMYHKKTNQLIQSQAYQPHGSKPQNLINRRKMEFQGQAIVQDVPILHKSNHRSIFIKIGNYFEQVVLKKRMGFLNMLAVWTQEKLQRTINTLQSQVRL